MSLLTFGHFNTLISSMQSECIVSSLYKINRLFLHFAKEEILSSLCKVKRLFLQCVK